MHRGLPITAVLGPFLGLVAVLGAPAEAPRDVAELVSLPPTVLASRPPAVLHGQVIGVERTLQGTEAILEDATAGIRIVGIDRIRAGDGGAADVSVGDEIEVVGRAEARGSGAVFRGEEIAVTGRRPLPEPRRCDVEGFFAGDEDCRLVEVEGIVERIDRGSGEWHLELAATGRLFAATVPDVVAAGLPGFPEEPSRLVDAVVRVAGPATRECNHRGETVRSGVRVERREWFSVVSPAPTPLFQGAVVPPEAIGRMRPGERRGHRVATHGQVIHAIPGKTLFLQNGHSGIRVELAGDPAGGGETFVPGDQVAVAGFLDRTGSVVGLRNATAARISTAAPTVPLVATPETILAASVEAAGDVPGDYEGCLVAFSGLLLQSQPTVAGGSCLVLADREIVNVEADAATFPRIGATEPGSFVRVTGVAIVERGSPAPGVVPSRLRLFLRMPDDFHVIARPPWWTAARLLAVLGVTGAASAAALAWAVTLRRQLAAQRELLAAEMRSRRDAAIEFEATLRERNRLAANLHDTLQQTIGGIGFQLDACESAGRSDDASRHFAVARRMVRHAALELEGAVWAMRSLPLDGKSLAEALPALVSRVADGRDVDLRVRTEGLLGDLPEFVAGSVLLIVQEAVHNALKHGAPRRIEVVVEDDPAAGRIRAAVRDDGLGFAVGSQAGPRDGHFGLHGMRERAERLGGTLVVRSSPGDGTTVEACVQRRDYDAEIGASPPQRG